MAEVSNSILETVNSALGLPTTETAFDSEIILHINSALMTVYQNGVGNPIVVKDYSQSWDEFKDAAQVEGNKVFEFVKSYVMLKTKLLFDPPPPSTLPYMQANIDELLWRIRTAYHVTPVEEATDDG